MGVMKLKLLFLCFPELPITIKSLIPNAVESEIIGTRVPPVPPVPPLNIPGNRDVHVFLNCPAHDNRVVDDHFHFHASNVQPSTEGVRELDGGGDNDGFLSTERIQHLCNDTRRQQQHTCT